MDFIHRTFQDYLGAKAAVEGIDFDFLIANAHLDQWEDVIRMAVAHSRLTERTRLLTGIIRRDNVTAHGMPQTPVQARHASPRGVSPSWPY
ncbi:hypothetical protein ACIOHR_20100 [Streptomyces anulatus]